MAGIYVDKHHELSELLGFANNDQGATLLIPDLQRPYIWSPRQVVLLMDSLIRGWPFGTLLTWKVGKDDPVRELARPFWKVVDRTDYEDGEQVSKKNPPASFQMVLDGQQRVQSLLLAVSGDGWGFKMLDRDWNTALTDQRQRGRRGVGHWSQGCLCVDVKALADTYQQVKRIAALDYTQILKWVVMGGKTAQSTYTKPNNYHEPIPRADRAEHKGRYIRLSRLWAAAPAIDGLDADHVEDIAVELLKEHGVSESLITSGKSPVGSLLTTLTRVKKTRVTYLELAEFDDKMFTREAYSDAVVNIFTRLNTAGRTLTREDITFAWLKVGWDPAKTGHRPAAVCFDELAEQLESCKLRIDIEALVAGMSFIWSAFHAEGRLLTSNDLLKGDAIRPMATDLSGNWDVMSTAIVKVSEAVLNRGFLRHEHYDSLNALFVLWAWQYIAEKWLATHTKSALERDDFSQRVSKSLNMQLDRWLMCSQWAGRWASGSADAIAGYARRLTECAAALQSIHSVEDAAERLVANLVSEVKVLEADATKQIQGLVASKREMVRVFYAPLWIWHRLDSKRWEASKIPLRTAKTRKLNLDVDHLVAHALWERKVGERIPSGVDSKDEAMALINQIGNCSLLDKTFNISKGDKTLKSFLESVHDIKTGVVSINAWAKDLGLADAIMDPQSAGVDQVAEAIKTRDTLVRMELLEFIKGTRARMDA